MDKCRVFQDPLKSYTISFVNDSFSIEHDIAKFYTGYYYLYKIP